MTQTSLADGQLAATSTAILPSAGVRAHIAQIFLTNTDTAARTVNVYFKRGASGTLRRIAPKNYSIAAGDSVRILQKTNELHLSAADSLYADASAAGVIDYVICGSLSAS